MWETAKFNTRLQVTELGLGNSATDASVWKTNYEYGELQTNGAVDGAKNTGNIARQTLSFDGLAQPFVVSYKYDSLYRLTEAVEKTGSTANWSQQFGYDRYGNRTGINQAIGSLTLNKTPAVDAATNRFTSGQGFVYDKNGNVVGDTDINSSLPRQFTFNGDNKQTEVKKDGVTVGRYFYDGEGKRIKKITDTETTTFVYSAGKLIAEYSSEIASVNDAKVAYLTNDHLGSPRITTDATGQVISRHDYHPFGEEIGTLNGGSPHRTTALNYTTDSVRQKFTGYQHDTETNLDFAEARYYNPMHGRFTSVDPGGAGAFAENPQSWNAYAYVGNNPLTITDPTGLSWYYSSGQDRYKWFGDNDTVEDGFKTVVGTRGNDDQGRGSFVYEREGGGWVRLNPYTNSFSTFDTRDAATSDFSSVYQCNCQGLVNTIADESVKKGTTVAIAAGVAVAVGTGAGVAMAATGTAAGAGITTLGLTQTATGAATTLGAAAAANPNQTAQVLQTVQQLPDAVLRNFNRFASKVPANARSNASLDVTANGGYQFTATSAGNVPGSQAIYVKTVDAAGRTVGYIKTTIAPDGRIVHVKNKF